MASVTDFKRSTSGAKLRLQKQFLQPPASVKSRSSLFPGGWQLWFLSGLALGFSVWIAGRAYLQTALVDQLKHAQNEQSAIQAIEGLLQLNGAAAAQIVHGLTHEDFVVANAAYSALNKRMDDWNKLEPADNVRRLKQLMSQMQTLPPAPDSDHRILVTGIASRVYAQAMTMKEPGVNDILTMCKQLLQGESQPASQPASNIANESTGGRSEEIDVPKSNPVYPPLPPLDSVSGSNASPIMRTVSTPQISDETYTDTGNYTADLDRMPSSGLSSRSSMPRLSASEHIAASSARTTVQLVAMPKTLPLQESASPTPSVAGRHTVSMRVSDDTGYEDQNSARPSTALEHGSTQPDTSTESEASEPLDAQTLAGIDRLTIDQLVRLLASSQPRITQAASLALKRKGMSDDKLALAVSLANGTTEERQSLLLEIAKSDTIDPRPWLLWMADEGDSRVREQAIGLLSPLLDNEVRRQLRLLLNSERDERIAQTIRRVLLQP